MKIVSIEPTPSPNSMKLNMDENLPEGVTHNFTASNAHDAPDYIKRLFNIEGIKGIFHVNDFIAVEREPKADWKVVLPKVREVFEDGSTDESLDAVTVQSQTGKEQGNEASDAFGEIHVFVQKFRSIPMQIKLTNGTEETRVALPERFLNAAMAAESSSANLVMERKWEEQGVRYGDVEDVGDQLVEEISAAYDEQRLDRLIAQAFTQGEAGAPVEEESISAGVVAEQLKDADWKKRYAALEQMKLTKDEIPLLAQALDDQKMSIRRLATAYLGEIGESDVLPYLYHALEDKSATVRRTAGDCLSDVADPDAIEPMKKALRDPNKIVRWRAARFLYEVGDESAVSALREAEDDPEYEVSLQVKLALERIEGGEEAEGSVWQQMTRRFTDTD